MIWKAEIHYTPVVPVPHMVSGGYTLAYPGSVPGLAAALRRAMFS